MKINATTTHASNEKSEDILSGPFIRLRLGLKSIVGWSDGSISVYLFVSHDGGEEKLMQLVVNSSPLWDADEVIKVLSEWDEHPNHNKPLTVRAIRGIPVTKMLAESRRVQQAQENEVDLLGFIPEISISMGDGAVLGFSSLADFAASIEQLTTAIGYTAAIGNGAINPVRVVADSQFDGDLQKARNLLSTARRNNFLTRGEKGSGRLQGQLTPKANDFIKALKDLKEGKEQK